MANPDDIMDDMVASQELVPRVDKHKNKKRWGVDTPMFESREDMHGFLQDLGMAPGAFGADMLDSMLYMSEGELQNAMLSMGAAIPGLGMGVTAARKGKKAYDTSKATMRYGGKKQRSDRFKEGLQKRKAVMDKERIAQMQTNQSDLAQRRVARTNEAISDKKRLTDRVGEASKNMDQDHVEGLIKAENMAATKDMNLLMKSELKGLDKMLKGTAKSKEKGELTSAAYKAEEFFQRNRFPELDESFTRQARQMVGKNPKPGEIAEIAAEVRRNYLVDEAVKSGAMTGRERQIYQAALHKFFQSGNPTLQRIRQQVRQSLHAEDLSKAGLGVEITPKGVRATPASRVQTTSLPEHLRGKTYSKQGSPQTASVPKHLRGKTHPIDLLPK